MINPIRVIRSTEYRNSTDLTSSRRFLVINNDFRRLGVDTFRTEAPSLLSLSGARGVSTSVPCELYYTVGLLHISCLTTCHNKHK